MTVASNSLLVNLIITAFTSGAIVAGINAVASRRKTRAEADKTHAEIGNTEASAARELSDTAIALLVPLREELKRLPPLQEQVLLLSARVTQQDSEIAELRHTVDEGERSHAVQLRAYADWARLASQKLTAAQIQIDPPPPL